ncbi:MAG TPA: hypothetical protein VGJ98_02345 [Candidatus Eisenbacteria bacterium]
MSPTGRSRIGTTLLAAAAFVLAAVACILAGCAGMQGNAPRRVLERDETVGNAHVLLKSELSPARGTLGDRIAWRLTASLGPGAKPGDVRMQESPASLQLDASKPPVLAAGRGGVVWSREYTLRGFDLGALELPQAFLPVTVGGKADTLEFPRDTLFVDSLTAAATGSIRPDRGPMDPPLRPVDYAVAALVALLLGAALVFLIRRWLGTRGRRRSSVVSAPPEPAEAILDRALSALESELRTLPRDVFYERLALALRTYAAAVTGVPAPDLTTTELDRELARAPNVLAGGREDLIAALRRADLAKFGRFEDEESEARSILRQARSISGRLVAAPALTQAAEAASRPAGADSGVR